ncbi:uncharacterized protein LOC126827396 [Patella vulgata]|uniref:uncharacterized protein LOC126827396 n=1 Tax=Patella vulgata TaxID=6465 RepID=UPI00217FE433|nr:uncharacterized protein LOC126827396 [Patella vulgata]
MNWFLNVCLISGLWIQVVVLTPNYTVTRSVIGCHTELLWQINSSNIGNTINITKDGVQVLYYRIEDSIQDKSEGRYELHLNNISTGAKERVVNVTLIITNVTMNDSGFYDVLIENTRYNRIRLVVADFKWKNALNQIEIRVGDIVNIIWKYETSSTEFDIILYRVFSASRKTRNEQLARWSNGFLKEQSGNNRMLAELVSGPDGKIGRVELRILDIEPEDINYVYKIGVQFNGDCIVYDEPVTLRESNEFYWLTHTDPLITTPRKSVNLVWEYHSKRLADKIIFTRYSNVTSKYEKVGMWSRMNGFETYINSTEFDLNKVIDDKNEEERIILGVSKPITADINSLYYCRVFIGDTFSSISQIQLITERPKLIPVDSVFITDIGDSVKFIWAYQYRFTAATISIKRKNYYDEKIEELGYWYRHKFELMIKDTHKLLFQITPNTTYSNGSAATITVMIVNTTDDDLNSVYICSVTFTDGETSSSQIAPEWNVTYNTQMSEITANDISFIKKPVNVFFMVIAGFVLLCVIITISVYIRDKFHHQSARYHVDKVHHKDNFCQLSQLRDPGSVSLL